MRVRLIERRADSSRQATGQCARWLARHLPPAVVVGAASAADAVRQVAGAQEPRAAIGTRFAAERYGAVILEDGVEDDPANATRFAWLVRAEAAAAPPRDGPATTALVFWGAGSGAAGWLVACLDEFARRSITLPRIESRPLRRGMGEYMFFLDLDGSASDPGVAEALAALHEHAEVVRLLGSYAAAGHGAPAP